MDFRRLFVRCRLCGNKIPVRRSLQKHEFCCDAHHQEHSHLSLARLLGHLRPAEDERPAAAGLRPIPLDYTDSGSAAFTPRRDASWERAVRLPEVRNFARPAAPRAADGLASLTVPPGHRPATLPRCEGAQWEPRAAVVSRRSRPATTLRPAVDAAPLTRVAAEPLRMVRPSVRAPALPGAFHPPPTALRPRPKGPARVQPFGAPARNLELAAVALHPAFEQARVTAVPASFDACDPAPVPGRPNSLPRARPLAAPALKLNTPARTRRPVREEVLPLDPEWRDTAPSIPEPAPRLRKSLGCPPLAVASEDACDRPPVATGGCAPTVWRPRAALAARRAAPRRIRTDPPRERDRERSAPRFLPALGRLWRSASVPVRLAVIGAPLGFTLPAIVPHSLTHETSRLVRQRAAVDLADDFSDGLVNWRGAGDWSFDRAGWVRPGKLAVFAPASALSDYRLEFRGQIEKKSLSWAFRVADSGNYYAMKITIVRPGPLPRAALVRYSVVAGAAGARVQIPLPSELRGSPILHVSTSVYQDRFVTSVDGRMVDSFSDGRHTTGGVALFRETGESWRVLGVRVADRDDFLGRACAYLSGNSADRNIWEDR